jgi:hypothetical protein
VTARPFPTPVVACRSTAPALASTPPRRSTPAPPASPSPSPRTPGTTRPSSCPAPTSSSTPPAAPASPAAPPPTPPARPPSPSRLAAPSPWSTATSSPPSTPSRTVTSSWPASPPASGRRPAASSPSRPAQPAPPTTASSGRVCSVSRTPPPSRSTSAPPVAPPRASSWSRPGTPPATSSATCFTRWVHLIAGIMWIGNSMLFNWLDRNLERAPDAKPGLVGNLWMVHSGGFYEVEKKALAPSQMPKTLHWFKWQNGITWLSGISLLILVFYMAAASTMVDPEVADITANMAVLISAVSLPIAYLAYDLTWRTAIGKRPGLATLLTIAVVIAASAVYFSYFSGRAAYMHVGVLIGTVMTGNVWFVILPSQRELIAATVEGREQDPAIGYQAKQRSIHNNYFTFPLLFIMLSGHFPSTFSHPQGWLILTVLALGSAGIRHLMNIRYTVPAPGCSRRGHPVLQHRLRRPHRDVQPRHPRLGLPAPPRVALRRGRRHHPQALHHLPLRHPDRQRLPLAPPTASCSTPPTRSSQAPTTSSCAPSSRRPCPRQPHRHHPRGARRPRRLGRAGRQGPAKEHAMSHPRRDPRRRVVTPEGTRPPPSTSPTAASLAVADFDAVPPATRHRRGRRRRPSCPASSTPTSTSTSPAAPTGRASTPRRGPPPPAESPPWSTCRSTRSPRPPPSPRLRAKQEAAHGQCGSTSASGAASCPATASELAPMAEAGALGFKCFLSSPASRSSAGSTRPSCAPAMHELARIRRTLLVHAELPGPIDAAEAELAAVTRPAPLRHLPRLAPARRRERGDRLVVRLVRDTRARTHIVHHASADALPQIAAGPGRRPALLRRDLPALPRLRRRGHRRRRHRLQVRPTDPRARQP